VVSARIMVARASDTATWKKPIKHLNKDGKQCYSVLFSGINTHTHTHWDRHPCIKWMNGSLQATYTVFLWDFLFPNKFQSNPRTKQLNATQNPRHRRWVLNDSFEIETETAHAFWREVLSRGQPVW
jgi:hypothetical protein